MKKIVEVKNIYTIVDESDNAQLTIIHSKPDNIVKINVSAMGEQYMENVEMCLSLQSLRDIGTVLSEILHDIQKL